MTTALNASSRHHSRLLRPMSPTTASLLANRTQSDKGTNVSARAAAPVPNVERISKTAAIDMQSPPASVSWWGVKSGHSSVELSEFNVSGNQGEKSRRFKALGLAMFLICALIGGGFLGYSLFLRVKI